jgi:hypothetical protein
MTEPLPEDVERVARAICKALGYKPDKINQPGKEPEWTRYKLEARAAIRAMQRGDK